ncbi:MAG: ribonuclease P protein component [Desertimonas sp.]
MIGSIRQRRRFEELRRTGRRAGTEHLWCRYLSDPAANPPRVAFAIGRIVGPAVVRNRLRRRLRALLRLEARDGALAPSWMLIGARPTAVELTYDQLRVEVRRLIERAAKGAA